MNEPFYDETFFFVPERNAWNDFIPYSDVDDLELAENVLDDIILIEV